MDDRPKRAAAAPASIAADATAALKRVKKSEPNESPVPVTTEDEKPRSEKSMKFPDGFIWGTATASYQIEGAANEDGRGPSIWDAFSQTMGKTSNGDTGDIACDHYHLFESDIQLMADMELRHYRFSISWSRLLPRGLYESENDVNRKGVDFYNRLIDGLLARGIEPYVTLYHWDLPLALDLEYDGWLNKETVVPAFEKYAKLCFQTYGDRVKHWITLNEPWCCAFLGYETGEHAPGRKMRPSREPYTAAHSLLLAHARAVRLYRESFATTQRGRIGITLNSNWCEPLPCDDPRRYDRHQKAAQRALEFELGWFADPVYFGDYPTAMKETCGERLPSFTSEEKNLIRGSSDFFGLNHYSTSYGSPGPEFGTADSYSADMNVTYSADPSWPKTDMGWSVVPFGIGRLLEYIQERYRPPGGIIVTENGCAVDEPTRNAASTDTFRTEFYRSYLTHVHRAVQRGVDVRGYFAWSFCDNFEWAFGYTKRFGLHFVDYTTQKRYPKSSSKWYSTVIQTNEIDV